MIGLGHTEDQVMIDGGQEYELKWVSRSFKLTAR
jgi:hypothetical protein